MPTGTIFTESATAMGRNRKVVVMIFEETKEYTKTPWLSTPSLVSEVNTGLASRQNVRDRVLPGLEKFQWDIEKANSAELAVAVKLIPPLLTICAVRYNA